MVRWCCPILLDTRTTLAIAGIRGDGAVMRETSRHGLGSVKNEHADALTCGNHSPLRKVQLFSSKTRHTIVDDYGRTPDFLRVIYLNNIRVGVE